MRQQQTRSMAGHAAGPHISHTHTAVGKAYMTVMFTWIGYRFYHDGAALLVSYSLGASYLVLLADSNGSCTLLNLFVGLSLTQGLEHPWEHGGHDDHGDGHAAHKPQRWREVPGSPPELVDADEEEEAHDDDADHEEEEEH